jgi:spore maturation protein CgeB
VRLIHIATNYPIYLNQFYAQHPELRQGTYAAQHEALMADGFGWADFWSHALGKLGYESRQSIGNAEPLQKTWAAENGIAYDDKTWMTDIVAAQIKSFKPDILFVNDWETYTPKFINYLRMECPSIRLIFGWCGSPYPDRDAFKVYDIVLSCHPGMVSDFRKIGYRSEYLCHAFDARILERIDRASAQTTPFSFIGSIMTGEGFHDQRVQLLKKLIQKTELQPWLYFYPPPRRKWLLRPLLARRSLPPLFGTAMFQKLYESKVTLNTHGDIAGSFACNMRLFEATGVGTCLLTDWKPNLCELFEPDKEVVVYRSAKEAIEKARYLIDHDDRRREIAQAGQRRTLKNHNFDLRARQLDELIRKNIG